MVIIHVHAVADAVVIKVVTPRLYLWAHKSSLVISCHFAETQQLASRTTRNQLFGLQEQLYLLILSRTQKIADLLRQETIIVFL